MLQGGRKTAYVGPGLADLQSIRQQHVHAATDEPRTGSQRFQQTARKEAICSGEIKYINTLSHKRNAPLKSSTNFILGFFFPGQNCS